MVLLFVSLGRCFLFDFNIIRIQIGKSLHLPMFLSVFAINYFLLYRTYIKMDREKMLLKTEKDITRSRVLFARFFLVLSMFLSIAILIVIAVYYGKNIGYLK